MSDTQKRRDTVADKLAGVQEQTGRQDIIAPSATAAQSDPTPVDVHRGNRLWVGIAIVAIIFIAIIAYFEFVN